MSVTENIDAYQPASNTKHTDAPYPPSHSYYIGICFQYYISAPFSLCLILTKHTVHILLLIATQQMQSSGLI